MKKQPDPILSIRLPRELSVRLDKAAKNLNLSKNDISRHAIRGAVAAIESNKYSVQNPLDIAVTPRVLTGSR